jgi:protein TonB
MMKKLLILSLLFLFAIATKAQTTSPPDIPELDNPVVKDTSSTQGAHRYIFTSVEMAPEYPGGIDGFVRYIALNLRYPRNDFKNKIEGKVNIAFVVDRDGSLTQIKILKGVSPDIDAEAIRLIKNSPKWKPGIQNGRAVPVSYSILINFKLPPQKN